MPKTIRNEYYKKLSYESLMKAHLESRKGKSIRKEIILFNMKQEDYIMWLYEQLKNRTYKHSGYTAFYVTEPKLRRIEKSKYIDRIVHRWYVDNFLQEYFVKSFSYSSFACLKDKGMHKACLYVQNMMKHCKRIWNNYYIIKMDVAKYFQNIDKQILYEILSRKIKDENLLWLTKEILYSNGIEKGLPIGKVIGKITFKFIINSKNKAVASFNIETPKTKIQDKQIIKLKAYNELADFAYSRLKENDQIFINGKIEENCAKIKSILIF